MKKLCAILLAIGITLSQFIIMMKNTPVYKGTQALKKELKTVSVRLFSLGDGRIGTCSGTIVNEVRGKHHILTAKHCIHRTDEFYVDNVKAKLVITSTKHDLAYIVLKGRITGKKPARIPYFDAYIGQTIHHIGYPQEHLYISTGKVHRKTDGDSYAFIHSRGGCSGGGMFNDDAELVGVLWGGYDTHKAKMTIYEPVENIRRFLKEIEYELRIDYKRPEKTFINVPDPKPVMSIPESNK